jgi:UDP-N-acetylmuramate dehydrogenase
MGGEMKDVVKEVEAYHDGEIVRLSSADCRFGYRDSIFKHGGGVVLRAVIALKKGEPAAGMRAALAHLKKRSDTQPQGQSIGCIFKNPEGDSAGRLIDQAGLKGARVGDAEVSAKHCNFILNKGKATAADVLALIEEIKQTVYDRSGIALEEEIFIL